MSRKFFRNDRGINLGTATSDPTDGIAGSFYFNSSTGKLRIYNGSIWKNVGSGTGFGDVDTMSVESAEEAVLADFTQTGLEILATTGLIHQDVAFRLVHQAASTRSVKKTIAVDSKFRGKTMTLSLDVKSSAQAANLTMLVRDETNSANLLASSQIQTDSTAISVTTTSGSQALAAMSTTDYNTVKVGMIVTGSGIPTGTTIQSKNDTTRVVTLSAAATASATVTARFSSLVTKRTFSFTIPENCSSISWTISALAESNSPESYFDDISIYVSKIATQNASVTMDLPIVTDWQAYTVAVSGSTSGGGKGTVVYDTAMWRRVGDSAEILWNYSQSAVGPAATGNIICSLPPTLLADTAKARASLTTGSILGSVWMGRSSSQNYTTPNVSATGVFLATSAGFSFVFGSNSSTTLTTDSLIINPFENYSGLTFSLSIRVPIAGWASTTSTTKSFDTTSAVFTTEPDAELRVAGFSQSAGTTATRILRTLSAVTPGTIQASRGTAIQILDDSANGTRIVARQDGVYSFTYSADVATSAVGIGFSLNSASLTTDFASLTAAEKLASTFDVGGNSVPTMSWTGYLRANDVVRLHSHSAVSSTDTFWSMLQVTYQGRIKQLNASSDQKIEIPTHELRFEGSTSRGSTDTAIVKFDTLTNFRGDGFSVSNTAANGTVVTVQKDGILTVGASLFTNTTGIEFDISRNQAVLTTTPTASEFLAQGYVAGTGVQQASNPSWSGTVKAGDKIRIASNGNPTSNFGNNLNMVLQELKVQVALSNVTPQFTDSDQTVRVENVSGYGSTATTIPRFSTTQQNTGSGAFVMVDDAVNGTYVKILKDGTFSFSFSFLPAVASTGGYIALSKNQTSPLNTSSIALTGAELLAFDGDIVNTSNGSNKQSNCCWTGACVAGDIIRPVTTGLSANVQSTFTAAYIGKPSMTAVDITPFVNLKASAGDIGELTEFAGAVADDYLLCDGTAVSRTKYADLFNYLGLSHGSGDGSTTFNLPDYRGRFLRMVDGSAGRDPDKASRTAMNTGGNTGNSVGSVQTDALQGHFHTFQFDLKDAFATGTNANWPSNVQTDDATSPTSNNATDGTMVREPITDGTNGTPRTSAETRPSNAYVNIGIRWRAAASQVITQAKSYRMSDYLANGSRVTGVDPAALGEYRALYRATPSNFALSDCTSLGTVPSLANGMQIYGDVAYGAAGTSTRAYFYRIFIGKNKQFKIDWFANTGRSGMLCTDYFENANSAMGAMTRYDPTTGVLEIDATYVISANPTSRYLGNGPLSTSIFNGYFDVTVFDSPFVAFPRLAPTTTRITSGTGNYTPPPGCLYFEVEAIGGGGGGANTTGTGGTGGTTTFGSSMITCNGGAGGSGAQGGAGGTATVGGAAQTIVVMQGNGGGSGQQTGPSQSGYPGSGAGGAGPWGGAGQGTSISAGGVNGAANSGAGGSGSNPGLSNNSTSGGGGGAGGYAKAMVAVPNPVISYPYSVGAGGAAGGSTGGSGVIIIREYYR